MGISPEQTKDLSLGINKEGSREGLFPPPPSVVLAYENGQGNIIQEIVTLSSWRDSQLIEGLRQKKEELEARTRNIPHLIKQASQRKRKHGGERIPGKQRKGVIIDLGKETGGIEANISQITHFIIGIGRKVDESVGRSDPRSPLKLSVKVFGLGGSVEVRGEPLSKDDQEWWKFIRKEASEIWGLVNDEKNYELLHQLFLARMGVYNADIDHQGREKAELRLENINEKLSKIPDQDYIRLNPSVKKIINFFSRTTKPV